MLFSETGNTLKQSEMQSCRCIPRDDVFLGGRELHSFLLLEVVVGKLPSLRPSHFISGKKNPQYPLYRTLCEFHSQSGHVEGYFSCTYRETKHKFSFVIPVA
jgi:hypothetical protein